MGRYVGNATIRDSYNRLTRKSVQIQAINDDAAALLLYAWLGALDNIIRGTIERVTLTTLIDPDNLIALKNNPVNEANVDVGCTLYALTEKGRRATIKVPTFNPDLADADGSVDVTSGAVKTFCDQYTGLVKVLASDFEPIERFLFGVLDKK